MKASGRARARAGRDEEAGQLLILAGVILVMAFMMSVLTVHELASQQQFLAQGPASPMPEVFRELRDRVAATLNGLTYPAIGNATFRTTFAAAQADAQRLADRHAAQLVVRLADANDTLAPKNETFFTDNSSPPRYTAWSYNGSRSYTSVPYDGTPDGIIFDQGTGQVKGAIIYLVVADPASRIEETFVAAVN